jgi:hypothetical protein
MRLRTTLFLPRVALLGAVAATVGALAGAPQALAAPSEVKLEIAEHCYFAKWPCWNVEGNNPENIRDIQPFTIAQGGTISFKDSEASYPTDVIWKGTPPSCTSKVPSTPETNWNGTCTFANAGEYEFESQDLFIGDGFNYTQYKVIVKTPGAPVLATGMASSVNETEGTLQATVDPEGKETKYFFEWGKSSGSYEHVTTEVTLGFQDTSSHDVSEPLSDLAPGTTYHYRVLAKNSAGTTHGEDRMLTTASPPGPPNATTPPPSNTPSPISSPIGGNPIATTSTTPSAPSAPSQGATTGPPVVPPTILSTEKATKPLTQAQKLATALKQCKKQPKKKRAQCETKARKLYTPKHKSHKK